MDSNGTSELLLKAKNACASYEKTDRHDRFERQCLDEMATYSLLSIAENLEKLVNKTGWLRTER